MQAQPAAKIWRLGVLTINDRATFARSPVYGAFIQELRALGYREGENLVIEWRHTQGQSERRRQEAAALMAWKPDVVFTVTDINAIALRNANPAVPIVGVSGDLVGMRLAASLSRPGGNVTGLQTRAPDLAAKRLQLLKELLPKLQRVALLHAQAEEDPGFYDRIFADLQSAAPAVGVTLIRVRVRNASDLEKSFAEMADAKADAVLVVASPFMAANISARRRARRAAAHPGHVRDRRSSW
ncbi:MAG TPA: ABC transporter substrate-binding protein [Burkholderiales bacterium]|nr:ABC transporter substrate-binding protein [Burkholderiales bacterium]